MSRRMAEPTAKPRVRVREASPTPAPGWKNTGYGAPSQIGVSNDMKRLEELLGDKFDMVEKIRDYYIKKLEEKDKIIDNLRIHYIHIPPYPDDRPPVEITNTNQLLPEAIKTESYKHKYLITEANGDMMGRLDLLAYLDIMRDFSNDELTNKPEDYFNTAIADVQERVDYYMRCARESKTPFSAWVNENIRFDDLY